MGKRKENREALQRLMARDLGAPREQEPAAPPPGRGQPRAETPQKTRTKKLSALAQKRRRRRLAMLGVLILAAAGGVAVLTGAISSTIATFGDVMDSITLYLDRTGGYPVSTGISKPIAVKELSGGFVELGAEDVAVYSAYGSKIRAFQPGYARPAIAVGSTRFCVYNRAGTELQVESRTKRLYTKNFSSGILLCAMSNNGNTAVVTESSRYAAQVEVYDSLFRLQYTWNPTQDQGTPTALRFAPDNHRFAAACLTAQQGQLATTIYLMDTDSTDLGVSYTADAGSMALELDWLSGTRLLAVFDHYAAILDPSTGAEVARYEYGGNTLQSVAVGGRDTALLLSSRTGSTLVVLDEKLQPLGKQAVGQALSVSCTRTAVYVLSSTGVACYGFDAALAWQKTTDTAPAAVLDARVLLLFAGSDVTELTPPQATPE